MPQVRFESLASQHLERVNEYHYQTANGAIGISDADASALVTAWPIIRQRISRSVNEHEVSRTVDSLSARLEHFSIYMSLPNCQQCCTPWLRVMSGRSNAHETALLPLRGRNEIIPRLRTNVIRAIETIFSGVLNPSTSGGSTDDLAQAARRINAQRRRLDMQARNGWGPYRNMSEAKEPRNTSDFSAFIEKKRRQISRNANGLDIISSMPIARHGSLSSRRWGIEVECVASQGVDTPSGWSDKYDGSLTGEHYSTRGGEYTEEIKDFVIEPEECPATPYHGSYYRENHARYWIDPATCNSCGSVQITQDEYERITMSGEYADDEEGAREFVSPILKSFHSRGLEQLLGDIALRPSNDTPGIHVHVDAEGLTAKQIGAVVYSYGILEHYLKPMYRRETQEYCHEWEPSEIANAVRSAKSASRQTDVSYVTRYSTVNLQALQDHGTIEFRAMGPIYADMDATDSYEYLIKWASFVRELVTVAANDCPMKRWNTVRNADDILGIFEEFGREYTSAFALDTSYEE